jgi:hypothetical protein
MELHEKIAKVRETLAERGFAKNTLCDRETDAVCLRGAQGVALYGNPYDYKEDEVDRFLFEQAVKQGYSISNVGTIWQAPPHVNFNNDPRTTAADMDDFLHEAEIAAKELCK